jgi:hypothetical protein
MPIENIASSQNQGRFFEERFSNKLTLRIGGKAGQKYSYR